VVCGQIVKDLRLTTGPANGGAQGAFRFSQPEEKFLAVLRQKPRTGLEIFRLTKASHFQRNSRADSIAIALFSLQAESNGGTNVLHRVVQDAELRRGAIFQNDFQPPIVIKVGQHK